MTTSSDTRQQGSGGAGPGPRQARTDPGTAQRGPGTEAERLVQLLRTNPDARWEILSLVSHEMGRQVDGVEQRMGARMQDLARAVRSRMAEAVGTAVINLGGAGRQAAASVASYPRSFKFAMVAVFALFCAVSFLCVEHVRGAVMRAEERDAMYVLLDEARTTVAQVAGAQEEIDTHGRAITGLIDATERNTAFRKTYEEYDLPVQMSTMQLLLGDMQTEIEDLRTHVDARMRRSERATQEVAHRVAPIEAVTLTNRTRYYRGPLDEMASTRCTEAERSVSRASPDFHVRTCTDGFNGQEYQLWCAQKHRGERFSGCTSTDPFHRS